MAIGERIKYERERVGLTQSDLAEMAGVNSVTLSKWESGLNEPKLASIRKIAGALSIPVSALISGDDPFSRQSDNPSHTPGEPPVWIDVVEPVVCAGNGNGYVEIDWEPVGRYPFSAADLIGYSWHSGKMRIIQIEGNSMEPRYRDGDRIMFSEEDVSSGDVAIVLWDGKLLIRGYVLERDNTVHLRALNRENPEIIVYPDDERFQVLGKVLGRVSRFEPDKGFW